MMNSNLFRVKGLLFFAAALLLAACNQQDASVNAVDTATDEVPVVHTKMTASDGVEKYVATLSVDGMGCAMACGSKISGALAGLDGVSNTDIDFVGAGEENSAMVEFDASKISEKEMIDAVQGLSGGHYKVKGVQVVHYIVSTPTGGAVKEENEKVSNLKPGLQYSLPNIFSVFSRLF